MFNRVLNKPLINLFKANDENNSSVVCVLSNLEQKKIYVE